MKYVFQSYSNIIFFVNIKTDKKFLKSKSADSLGFRGLGFISNVYPIGKTLL